jgi:transposase InsO family protein
MSRKGNCWDNAVAESFFKTIKHEWLLRFKYKNYDELYNSINEYITWYNTKRIHSTLAYLSPLEKEMELRKIKNKAA